MTKKNNHTKLVSDILAYYKDSPSIYVWKNNSGSAKIGDRFISFGKKGSPDIIGFAGDGRFIGIECKTGTGKLEPLQRAFAIRAEISGCIYIIGRSLAQVVELLNTVNSFAKAGV